MSALLHSLESIDFQGKSSLAMDLVIAVTELQKLKRVGQLDVNNAKLSKIIRGYTNLLTKVSVVPGEDAHVMVPHISKNNPILNDMRKYYFFNNETNKEILKKDKYVGLVDLKNSKVKGDFSEVLAEINIGEDFLKLDSKYTPEEVVAIILHEVGHVFVLFEMLGRYSRTNYYLESAMRRIMNSETKEQRIQVLEQLENLYGEKIPDKERLSAGKQPKDIYRTVFISAAVNESYNQLGFNVYDLRGYEQLADQFASRHGMGLALATGLDKLFKDNFYREYWWKGYHYIIWVLEAVIFISSTILTFGLSTLILGSINNVIYDPANRRIEKIKQDTIHALKDPNLSNELRDQLLETIKVIDSLLEEMRDNEGFYSFLWNHVIPWGRKEKKTIIFNEELERMLNNQLFVASQLLKHKTGKV